jgi:hypothetical protein
MWTLGWANSAKTKTYPVTSCKSTVTGCGYWRFKHHFHKVG